MNQNKIFGLLAPIYELIHFGANRTLKKLLDVANFDKKDKVLDLGGGVGRIAKKLALYVSEITVADVSEGMIQQCRKHDKIKCVFLDSDILPFPESHFDKVIIVDAFHHFENQPQSIREIKRVLRSGGTAVLQEINTETIYGKFVRMTENISGITHSFHAPHSLENIWEESGFTVTLHDENKGSYYLVAQKDL